MCLAPRSGDGGRPSSSLLSLLWAQVAVSGEISYGALGRAEWVAANS